MDFFKANDVLKGLRVSAAPTEAEKTALRRDKLEACKIVVDHLFTPQVMFVHILHAAFFRRGKKGGMISQQ